jgi:RNA polymerase sigma-70 factor (ECF subfamily)
MYERGTVDSGLGWHPLGSWAACLQQTQLNDNDPIGNTSDGEVIRRIQAGDRNAFLQFYDRYASLLLSVAARVLGERREAEDVVQEVFTQIWRKSAGYDPGLGSLSSWVVTLARNKAIDRIRASTRRRRLLEEIALSAEAMSPEPPQSANDSLYGRERAQRIHSALADLAVEQRQVIELAFFAGLTQSEIATRLDQPLGTVKARIRRGMLRLREQLGDAL